MYEAYFGFSQRPFAAAPLANRYFPAASVDAARQMLARCIERGAGAGVLIGPPGTGKSLLLQVLAAQFADRMAAVQLAGGQLGTRRELLQAILFELKLPYRGMEEGELRLALVDHLTRGDKCPQGMLLLVDEAQTLPALLLEELRMMTNLARGGESRVRLVLAGSMELEELLAGPDLQAFAQRLAARCYLESFDLAETVDYLRFQVAVAGGQAERVFDAGALEAVYRATEGIPRLVNQLRDHALLLAYQAERRPLDAKAIDIAWADLQQLPSPWQHEHAADERSETIEFGALVDDEPTTAAAVAWPGSLAEEPSAASADAFRSERVEIDFSEDWPADAPRVHLATTSEGTTRDRSRSADSSGSSARTAKANAKGLRIVEDLDKLQVVIDPYNLDDDETEDDEPEDNAAEDAVPAGAKANRNGPRHVWEDVAVPAQPPGWASTPAPRASPTPKPILPPASFAPSVAATKGAAAPMAQRSLEEEIVADRYAELDARQPPPSARPSSAEVARVAGEASPVGAMGQGEADLDELLEERMTLAEAIRLCAEAETAAAAARVIAQSAEEQLLLAIDNVPPLPSPEDWLTDSATMLLDPTQMPPDAARNGSDLGSDIVVIEEDSPSPGPAATQPVHRVERRDYKSLFARLRRG